MDWQERSIFRKQTFETVAAITQQSTIQKTSQRFFANQDVRRIFQTNDESILDSIELDTSIKVVNNFQQAQGIDERLCVTRAQREIAFLKANTT